MAKQSIFSRVAAHLKDRLSPSTIAREVGQTFKEQAAVGAAELRHNLAAFPQQTPPQYMGPESYARTQQPQQQRQRGMERS